MLGRTGRILGSLAGGLIILILAGIIYQAIGTALDERRYQPPGQLIEVNGSLMHLFCTGQGSPTVVMESGGAAWSLDWSRTQPEIAKLTRVCSYDRAGYGWSEPRSTPRTSKNIVRDLHALLSAVGVNGPYVLVGNSFGGYAVRLFASEFPRQVAGLVLVDVSHENQPSPMPPECWERGIEYNRVSRFLAWVGLVRLAGLVHLLPELEWVVERFPPELRPMARAGYYRTQTYDTLAAEFATYEQSSDQVRTAPARLEDTPLRVLVAGRYEYPSWCPLSAEQQQQLHQVWLQRQTELAQLSSQGVLTVAENSGHWIQLDQPELVVEAIRQVVERALTPRQSLPKSTPPLKKAHTIDRQIKQMTTAGPTADMVGQQTGVANETPSWWKVSSMSLRHEKPEPSGRSVIWRRFLRQKNRFCPGSGEARSRLKQLTVRCSNRAADSSR